MELIHNKPSTPSETKHYGKVLDPEQFKDPEKLGRVKIKIPELHSGIPDEDIPWSQLKRHGSYGTQGEMGHFRMPQKEAVVETMFGASDAYSPTGDGSPYAKQGFINEANESEKQHKQDVDKDPEGNFSHTDNDKKAFYKDKTQMDGPHYGYTRGETTHWYTEVKSEKSGQQDQGGGGGQAGTFAEEDNSDKAKYNLYAEKQIVTGVVAKREAKKGNATKNEAPNADLKAYTKYEKDKITIKIGNSEIVMTADSITIKSKEIVLDTTGDIKLKAGGANRLTSNSGTFVDMVQQTQTSDKFLPKGKG